jgi:hypothetical protein
MDVVISPLFGLHCVLGPRDVIPNLELISSLADHIKIDIWSMIPSLTDELGEAPDILPKLSRSKFICASGGKAFVPNVQISTSVVRHKYFMSEIRRQITLCQGFPFPSVS